MENLLFNSFFNNTIEGIIIIEEGFIKDINIAMMDILNYSSKEDIIGKLATGILIPNTKQQYLEYDKEIYEEVSLLDSMGKLIPAILKIKDLVIDNKNYKMVFILNLTELKERESMLVEQSRMAAMGEMISMIAHQWKQPLSSISSVVSNLRFRLNLNKYEKDTFETKLKDVDKYLNYMSGTIEDFRDFFKPGKEKQNISLLEIVKIALEMLEKPFLNKGINITNNKQLLKKSFYHKNEILQILLNILNNSKDAFIETNNIKDANIVIDYDENEEFQIIRISDNAGGIPKEIISKVFDPYFSTKSKKNGTGLGLYMCKTIIEKHCDGEINIFNKSKGTCVEIKISRTII